MKTFRQVATMVGAVAAALVSTAVVPLTASAASSPSGCVLTPDKCYSFTLSASPASPNTGQEATYTGVLANRSGGGNGVTLGSANVTLPSAFYAVSAGTASRGSETLSGTTLQLRDLSAPPGTAVTFTFKASSTLGGTYTFPSAAKQANNFSGVGNDLSLTGGSPTVTVSSFCSSGVSGYNDYGCSVIDESVGGTTSTNHLDSNGAPSVVSAAITYRPIAVPKGRTFASELRTDLGTAECPVALAVSCDFAVTIKNKIPGDYTIARDAVSLLVDCGTACDPTLPRVFFALNEATGVQEPLLPCTPLSPLASPVSGSYACYDDNGNSTYTVRHLTYLDDYKIMAVDVLG